MGRLNWSFTRPGTPHVQPYDPPPDNGLSVIYQDDSLLVLDKPCGLLSVPGRGACKQDSLLHRAQQRFADAQCVHRLDMETSGLMVLARGKTAQRALNGLFAQRQVEKQYIALVCGRLAVHEGEIHLPLICDWPNRPRQKVDQAKGKPSSTRYQVLHHDPRHDTTRLALQPITGRSHQLRVHLQSLGHSILGDRLYAPAGAGALAPRLLLHASALTFRHPENGRLSHFHSHAPF